MLDALVKLRNELEAESATPGSIPLNDEQRPAVACQEKLWVDGGPGSGKSSVLVAYLQRLLTEGGDASATLVVSFSNRCCQHLAKKIAAVCDPKQVAAIKIGRSTNWLCGSLASSGHKRGDQTSPNCLMSIERDRCSKRPAVMRPTSSAAIGNTACAR
ncbi:MAG: UvrD-helicase domain-containing protein [Anaerolineae bacterium]|nr:UvrD-helicase domain-containing protein [Anaerolineae bacterium]